MTRAWFVFYGRMLNMTRREIMATRYGDMLDLISCLAIYNGAEPGETRRKLTFDETLEVM